MARASLIVLTLWAGSLLTIGLLVAPVLFASLDDHALAGTMAARYFTIETWLSFLFAPIIFYTADGAVQRWLAVAIAVTLAVMHFGVAPFISDVSFGHTLAAGLYLLACLMALLLVFTFPIRAK